mmetsp:Transcript_27427/g.69168  ORF Transcript_27427/g.69168 Transcript_27427/m.69168 type:complete len:610 (+) Transcript_27427:329-2158(+)|eukprot:g16085.t1
MNLKFSFRGTAFDVPFGPDGNERLVILFDMLQELFDVRKESCTIVYHGKKISPYVRARDMVLGKSAPPVEEDAGEVGDERGPGRAVDAQDGSSAAPLLPPLPASVKILITGSTEKDIDFFHNARADPLVKGFEALKRDEKARRKRERKLEKESGGWGGSKMHAEWKFCKIQAEYKYNTPTPFEAEKLLTKLAHDPAIVKIMTDNKLQVGILTEMSPVEAQERMQREGKDGDLLGFNENYGGRIVLRLRTDDTKGFRVYHDLVNTLIHELVHNTFGPHDEKFWNLFREYKKAYDSFHNFYSRNGQSAGGGVGRFDGFDGSSSDEDRPQRLGGVRQFEEFGGSLKDRRARMAEIAEKRMKLSPGGGRGVVDDEKRKQEESAASSSPMEVDLDIDMSPQQDGGITHPFRCPCGVCMPVPQEEQEQEEPMQICKDAGGVDDEPAEVLSTERAAAAVNDSDARLRGELMQQNDMNDDEVLVALAPPGKSTPATPEFDSQEWISLLGHDGAQLLITARKNLQALVKNNQAFMIPVLHKLCSNLVLHPQDPKFKTLQLTNAKIRNIVDTSAGLGVLEALGFRREGAEDRLTIFRGREDPGKLIMLRDIIEQFLPSS